MTVKVTFLMEPDEPDLDESTGMSNDECKGECHS